MADDMDPGRQLYLAPDVIIVYLIARKGPDIPFLLKLYNEAMVVLRTLIAPMALSSVDAEKQPEYCIGCHSCEKKLSADHSDPGCAAQLCSENGTAKQKEQCITMGTVLR
ncbi:MAG: hypothetical protein V8R46_08395 [Eubacterium ramulus]